MLPAEIDAPVAGGLPADDNRMARCSVYAGRRMLEDAVALLGAFGPLTDERGYMPNPFHNMTYVLRLIGD